MNEILSAVMVSLRRRIASLEGQCQKAELEYSARYNCRIPNEQIQGLEDRISSLRRLLDDVVQEQDYLSRNDTCGGSTPTRDKREPVLADFPAAIQAEVAPYLNSAF